jgi:hypothetical protein
MGKSVQCEGECKHCRKDPRYHEKRDKNNVAVKKFRKDKSVKDLGKMKQLELVREENEALERSVAAAQGELDQMTTIFEAHARFPKVDQC